GADVDVILSPADLTRYNNDDFEIVGINPVWSIQSDVPAAPKFWMKGGDAQLSGSGNSLVISSNQPDLYSPSATFAALSGSNMPAYNSGDELLEFTSDGMQISPPGMGWVFILFSELNSLGDMIFGRDGAAVPACRLNATDISFANSNYTILIGGENDVDGQSTQEDTVGGGSPQTYPGGITLTTGRPYLMAFQIIGPSDTMDLFGIQGDGTDASSFKVRELLVFADTAVLTDDQISLIMQDMAYRAVSAGIGTLDDFLGSDHEHYASQPVSAGSGAGTINSVSAPVTTVTITAIDEDSSPIAGAAVHLDTADGVTNIIDGETDVSGEISVAYTGSIPQAVSGWVRSGSGSIPYDQGDIAGTINGDFSQTVILRRD
ncbi:MAG TPA: Ig-like domain-containing protein, partial [Candidatus Paceibacterota bacterium]|nr:Ig-like domain-containing protein [Candidatus Paceibacterota bacterium]